MRQDFVLGLSPAGFHRVAFREWGEEQGGAPLVCVHGLTRNGRDFEVLAERLAAERRVAAVDVVGRGASDRLADKKAYGYPQYMSDMTVLMARLLNGGGEGLDWLGTSMGGLIGMMLAAQPNSPIRRLIVNDVGPFIPQAALERIAGYLDAERRFTTRDEAERHLREIYAPFGLREADWPRFLDISLEAAPEGGYRPAYDPGIAAAFEPPLEAVDVWPIWDAITCPVLVLRGAQSDLLMRETAEEMRRRGPKAEIIEFENCGHAPALLEARQIAAVADWLAKGESKR
jgi:pimeloyl-ACP methyl ester carboxylesterase